MLAAARLAVYRVLDSPSSEARSFLSLLAVYTLRRFSGTFCWHAIHCYPLHVHEPKHNDIQAPRASLRQAGKQRPNFAVFKGVKAAGSNPLQKAQPGEGEHRRNKSGHLVAAASVTNARDSSSSPPHPITPAASAQPVPSSASAQPQGAAAAEPAVTAQQRSTSRQQALAQREADRLRKEEREALRKARCIGMPSFPWS